MKKKRLLANALAFGLAVSSFPVSVYAAEPSEDVVIEAKSEVAEETTQEADSAPEVNEETATPNKDLSSVVEEYPVEKAEEAVPAVDEEEPAEVDDIVEDAEDEEEVEDQDEEKTYQATEVNILGDTFYYFVNTDEEISADVAISLDEDSEVVFSDFSKIDSTDVYYYTTASTTGMLFGVAEASYTQLYSGQTSAEEYDAVASATTRKNNLFTSTNTSEVTEDGYYIYGIKNANIGISKEDYVKAAILNKADKLTSAYENLLQVNLNEDNSTPSYYLPYDGNSYGSAVITKRRVVDDATGELKYFTRYGTYQLEVNENSTNYLRKTRDNDIYPINNSVQGAILRGTDANGNSIALGVRHLKELWVSPYEIAFNPDTNASVSFAGGYISSVDYLTAEDVFTYRFATPVHVKPEFNSENVKTYFNENKTNILTISGLGNALENPSLSLSYREGRSTINVVEPTPVSIDNGYLRYEVTQELTAETNYTVTITSDNYADIVLSVTPETLEEDPADSEIDEPEEPKPEEPGETPEPIDTPDTPSESEDIWSNFTRPSVSSDSNPNITDDVLAEADRQVKEVVLPSIRQQLQGSQITIQEIIQQLLEIQRQLADLLGIRF